MLLKAFFRAQTEVLLLQVKPLLLEIGHSAGRAQRRPVSYHFQRRKLVIYGARHGRQLLSGRRVAAQRNLACAPVSLDCLRQIAAGHNLLKANALGFSELNFGTEFP